MSEDPKASKAAADSPGITPPPPADPPPPQDPPAVAAAGPLEASATPAPETATLLVADADGVINLGGIYYSAVDGEVQVPVLAVPDFLRRVPGSSIKEPDPGSPAS